MKGSGLASVAMANNLYEWIIVKGICENKDRYQKIVMESAISLCEWVLCDDSVLKDRNSQKITIKELGKLSGISIGHISK